MDQFNIPISELRQYQFCPRIPFFHLVLQLTSEGRPWLKQGLTFHDKTAMLTKRRNLSHYNLTKSPFHFIPDIRLYDEDLGLHGICDGALFTDDGRIFPLEFKLTEDAAQGRGSQVQLTAYAMLLERKEQRTIERGFLIAGKAGKTYEVVFTEALRQSVSSTVRSIRKACAESVLPASPASDHQCSQCEYLNFCADRL